VCGKAVSAREIQSLACRRSGSRHQRHSQLSDILWRAFKRASVPAVREPAGLSRADGKRQDGVTLLLGKRQTVDMGCHSTRYLCRLPPRNTATSAEAAADKAASNKVVKYRQIANSHIYVQVAI